MGLLFKTDASSQHPHERIDGVSLNYGFYELLAGRLRTVLPVCIEYLEEGDIFGVETFKEYCENTITIAVPPLHYRNSCGSNYDFAYI